MIKTRSDVKLALSEVFAEYRSGAMDRATASELTNIAGKWLKADSLDFAERVFEARIGGIDVLRISDAP